MNKIYDYLTPSEFTYDTSKIDVSGGIVSLKVTPDYNGLVGYWKFEDDVLDSSGQGNNGINNGATFVNGKVGRCLSFDGILNYVDCGDINSTEGVSALSVMAWIKPTNPTNAGAVVAKHNADTNNRSWLLHTSLNRVYVYLSSNGSILETSLSGTAALAANTWYHIGFVYDGSTVKIYINGTVNATTTSVPTSLHSSNIPVTIGRHMNTVADFFGGLIDEPTIYNGALSFQEMQSIYNSGVGRYLNKYSIDKPTIEPTSLFNPTTIASWDSFLETLGINNQGSIGYNLYKVDKTNKYYWNGSAWVTGGSSNNYNTVATINTNIGSFDTSPSKIGFTAYLISDGMQQVELDENQITYTTNQAPSVNAGSDKIVKHMDIVSPFSDAMFSDPDGIISRVYYDIENSGWIEILQGSFGSLLEAVQAFTYQFNNTGSIVCNLKVEDNLGATSQDSLIITTQHYLITFNVKDTQGNDLLNINFNPGDGSGWTIEQSPFTYMYEHNILGYTIILDKSSYGIITQNVITTIDHTENFTLIALLDSSDENFRIFSPIYDTNNNLTSATKRIYKNAADCDADINPISEYNITATYSTNGLVLYKITRL